MDRLKNQIAPLQKRADVHLDAGTGEYQSGEKGDESICFTVSEIHIEGYSQPFKSDIDALTAPHVGTCLSLPKINALVAEISNYYLEKGYVTSRAYIKPQDLSDGSLEIVILEGKVESLQPKGVGLSETLLKRAFPSESGGLLNIRDTEQGLENLNSLQRNAATIELLPGIQQGTSVIQVSNKKRRAWHLSTGVNNTGVPSTGELQFDVNAVLDNPFDWNDTFFISASSNIGEHELSIAESRSYALSWSFPYRYWHFSFNSNYYEYKQSVEGDTIEFLTHGSSLNNGLEASYVLARGQNSKFDAALSFTRKESRNYIEDVFLETSSRTLYVWGLSSRYLYYMPSGTLSGGLKIDASVPWFDAKRELVDAEDDFQFVKYQFDTTYNANFSVLDNPLMFSSSLNLFYSPKVILASEGLTVGGRYTVRGLSQDSLFGYRGGYLRNQVTMPVDIGWESLSRVQFALGVDAGVSNLPEYPDKSNEWVAGSVFSVTLENTYMNLSFSYARALRVPDFLARKQQEIDVSLRLSF